MPAQYPGIGWPADSQVDLLRKLVNNTALMAGGAGVTSIIAGAGISVNQATGAVTVSATGTNGNAYAAASNNASNTTITPTKPNQTTLLTFGGAARSSIIILDTAGRTAGDKLFLDLVFPATANIIISVRNATAGGTLLLPVESFPTQNLTTDGNLLSAHWEFTYTGTAWIYDMSNIPS